MSDSIQLEAYLEDQAEDGLSLGEAEFMVDRDSALAKLAQHSSPYPGAWLLKAVQAAVSSGCVEGIVVKATRRFTELRFDTARTWAPQEIQEAFLDPDPCADPVLGHLKFALWGAGISGKHPFELVLPGQWSKLVWDGESLREHAIEQLSRFLVLSVEHRLLGEPRPGYFAQARLAASINAESSARLSHLAYTCPVPLTLDGRRLDSLFLAPNYWHSNLSLPVSLGFLDKGGPPWALPQATFEAYRRPKQDMKPGLLHHLVEETAQAAPRARTASLAYLYVAHFGQKTGYKTVSWKSTTSKSSLYWVKDGVIVRHEVFPMEPTMLSVSCYVSAEGLAMDLTTLQLVASNAKGERTAEVIRAMSEELLRKREFDFSGLLADARRDDKVGGVVSVFLGLFLIMAVPVSLLMFWAAKKQFSEAGNEVRGLVEKVMADYPELQRRWCEVHGPYLPAGYEPPPPRPAAPEEKVD